MIPFAGDTLPGHPKPTPDCGEGVPGHHGVGASGQSAGRCILPGVLDQGVIRAAIAADVAGPQGVALVPDTPAVGDHSGGGAGVALDGVDPVVGHSDYEAGMVHRLPAVIREEDLIPRLRVALVELSLGLVVLRGVGAPSAQPLLRLTEKSHTHFQAEGVDKASSR